MNYSHGLSNTFPDYGVTKSFSVREFPHFATSLNAPVPHKLVAAPVRTSATSVPALSSKPVPAPAVLAFSNVMSKIGEIVQVSK